VHPDEEMVILIIRRDRRVTFNERTSPLLRRKRTPAKTTTLNARAFVPLGFIQKMGRELARLDDAGVL